MIDPAETTSGESRRATTESVVWSVPDNKRIRLGAPSLLVLPNGKWLVAFDQSGPDVKDLPGKRGMEARRNRWMQGRVMMSADHGATWQLSTTFPFRQASLFRDGGDVFLLGEISGRPQLMRSPDGGGSWSAPMEISGEGECWLSPTTVLLFNSSWLVPCLMPVEGGMGLTAFRAPRGASLMSRKTWTQGQVAAPLADLIPAMPASGMGVPWESSAPTWRHPVLVDVPDAEHPWHAPGRVHAFFAASSGRQHWAAMLCLDTESLTWSTQQTEEGNPWSWIPLPGGHDKFDLFYEESARAYWLLGSRGSPGVPVGVDAMREAEVSRIGLWMSDNLVDWQFAGTVFAGEAGAPGTRRDPVGVILGNDLAMVCRAGDEPSRHVRETTRILCRHWQDFRPKIV